MNNEFKTALAEQLMEMMADDAAEYLQRLETIGALDLSPLETVLMQHLIGQTENCDRAYKDLEQQQG